MGSARGAGPDLCFLPALPVGAKLSAACSPAGRAGCVLLAFATWSIVDYMAKANFRPVLIGDQSALFFLMGSVDSRPIFCSP